MRYYSASRDENTERIVDPLRVFTADGRSYLEAWCRQAEGMRVFRVDRIDDVSCSTSRPPCPTACSCATCPRACSSPRPSTCWSALRLGPAYAWVADYYPTEDAVEPSGDQLRIELRVADPAWVRALVLGSAGQVEVLSPEWLAEGVRGEAERALAAYAAK